MLIKPHPETKQSRANQNKQAKVNKPKSQQIGCDPIENRWISQERKFKKV